ncbi:OLC1v1020578C2 [Oldenlandia corymbosa var. corymbosa]|uniref:OLC1v1020578C2 n=1 Tax=Oldenlandia corymbosa var. corymbosa TaxID=529605 RepID=A0AAV1EGY6_OLDCO|nr:OLC1v1020578C2 [Oldenlandia corymbosa var. corymbosa]
MADSVILLSLICLVPAIFFTLLLIRKGFRRKHLPPSPLSLPIIGHLHHLYAAAPHEALYNLSKRYGPLMHLRLGSVPWVVASSPEIAKECLKAHDLSFSNRPIFAVVGYMTYGSQDFATAPYGPYWRFMKKVCMSELLGGKTLELLHPVRRDEIARFMDRLWRKATAGEAVDLSSEFVRLTNNVISRMSMSKRCSEDENEAGDIKKLIQEISVINGKFNVCDYVWFLKNLDLQGFKKRSRELRHKFDRLIEKIIEEHEAKRTKDEHRKEVKDLLDLLLDISEDESSQVKLSRENIKAFLLNMFTAGTGTSAITMEWALAELINNPDIMKKAVQEIDSVVGNHRLVDESDVANLPYLQAIVKETLRLHPAAPIMRRESVEDVEIRAMIQCFEWKTNGEEKDEVDMTVGNAHTLHKANALICLPTARYNPLPIST